MSIYGNLIVETKYSENLYDRLTNSDKNLLIKIGTECCNNVYKDWKEKYKKKKKVNLMNFLNW